MQKETTVKKYFTYKWPEIDSLTGKAVSNKNRENENQLRPC